MPSPNRHGGHAACVASVLAARAPTRTVQRGLAILVLLAAIGTTRDARAGAPALDVSAVPDGGGCPSSNELRRSITTHLGRDDFDAPDAPAVSVRVRRTTQDALVADVTLATSKTAPTTRVIDGGAGTCADLIRASALSIALALEAEAPAAAPAVAAAPAASAASAPEGAPSSVSRSSDLRRERVVLLASGMTQLGLLPTASAGAAASVRVRVSDTVWLSARGLFLPEARMSNEAFGMTLAAGGAGACIEPLGSVDVAALGCAHVVGGSLAVTHADVLMRSGGAKPFGAGMLSAGGRARVLGPVVVEGAVEAFVPFGHPTFLTEACPPSGFRQPFAAVALVFGAGVSIP